MNFIISYMDIKSESLSGIIKSITYYNPEDGFIVLRASILGNKNIITIVGNTVTATIGERIECHGNWDTSNKHGIQFKAKILNLFPPVNLNDIEKYLGSGVIKSIGPQFAKKIIKKFGNQVFDIIENKPDLLSSIKGIGKTKIKNINSSWQKQKNIKEIIIFLQTHDININKITQIYKKYGKNTIKTISNNPYQLIKDIKGIGFISADTIASKLGIEKNSIIRIRAGIFHILTEAKSNGHCYLPTKILIENSKNLLNVKINLIEKALQLEIESGFLIKSSIKKNEEGIFLYYYYLYEKEIAQRLLYLTQHKNLYNESSITLNNQLLSDEQISAVTKALTNKVLIITGGPGTGKTTLIKYIINKLKEKNLTINLCAPTGRAAKRLNESTGFEAITIHRLLEIDLAHRVFKRNPKFPLQCNYLIVDEMSMVDVAIFLHLLRALSETTSLILVGDVDQLPSVGPGQILKDIIESNVITVVKLTKIFRQEKESYIPLNAYRINNGVFFIQNYSDFRFIEMNDPIKIKEKILHLIKYDIPQKFNLNFTHDIQVLCPMYRGSLGVKTLNKELQQYLNPKLNEGINRFDEILAPGDKVMQTENNYEKEIYNGDIGFIQEINYHNKEVIINYTNKISTYNYIELDQITLAYAITIHKSQGSEYPVVIIPLATQSYMMLKRDILYTAVTRGKSLVIIVGDKKALYISIKNKTQLRYTNLKEWLKFTFNQ